MADIPSVRRLVCASLWLVTLALALAGAGLESVQLLALAWFAALAVAIVTVAVGKPGRDERLVRPIGYRLITGAVLAVAGAGAVLGLVPGASGTAQLFAVFFALAAFLAYRAVVARGPSAALLGVTLVTVLWVPFVVVTSIGCKCKRFPTAVHWTELASEASLQALLLLLPVLAAVAVLAFAPRRDDLPEARALR